MRTAPTSGVVRTVFGPRQWTRPRHDLGPVRARRSQHTVISRQVEARRWYQGGEFFEQFLWRQQQLQVPSAQCVFNVNTNVSASTKRSLPLAMGGRIT